MSVTRVTYFMSVTCVRCVLQFGAHGGVIGNAGRSGRPGAELAHSLQRSR